MDEEPGHHIPQVELPPRSDERGYLEHWLPMEQLNDDVLIAPTAHQHQVSAQQQSICEIERIRAVIEQFGVSVRAESRQLLQESVATVPRVALGTVLERTDIRSSLESFKVFPEYSTTYPETVKLALGNLFVQYNAAFGRLIEANREWETDYQFLLTGPNGMPQNFFVQIDMVGLPETFLRAASHMPESEVRELLRSQIFEIENSLAYYQLLERAFERNGQASHFQSAFRQSLDQLRTRFGKPIALLAVTDEKHQSLRALECGAQGDTPLADSEVRELTGFDRLFGPAEFARYVEQNSGNCEYLLYARTSDPLEKLKNPTVTISNPLLFNPDLRRVIKAYAITLNIDAPHADTESRINDTKEYLSSLGMALRIDTLSELISPELIQHFAKKQPLEAFQGKHRFSPVVAAFLESRGVDTSLVVSGKARLRAKPLKGTFGCYGHCRGSLGEGDFRKKLVSNINIYGSLVVQPELSTPLIHNLSDAVEYTFIDRVFFACTNGTPVFMGGVRNMLPTSSEEARRGRIHGNKNAVFAEIA